MYNIHQIKRGVMTLGRVKLGIRVGFYLSEVQIKGLKKLSKKTSISVSEYIRRAVDEYLEKYKTK
jgi:predicted DNA-binding protein